MKKIVILIISVMVCLCACNSNQPDKETIQEFVGSWINEEGVTLNLRRNNTGSVYADEHRISLIDFDWQINDGADELTIIFYLEDFKNTVYYDIVTNPDGERVLQKTTGLEFWRGTFKKIS